MQYVIPIFVVVEASSQAHVNAMKRSVEQFLSNPMVPMYLSGAGVTHQSVTVGEPYGAQPIPAVAAPR